MSATSCSARACCSAVTPGTPERSSGCAGSNGRGHSVFTAPGVVSWVCAVSVVAGSCACTVSPVAGSTAWSWPSALSVPAARLPASECAWVWACVPPVHMAGMARAATTSAGSARRVGAAGRLPTSSAAMAAPAAAAPSAAQMVSANWAASRVPRPSIQEMPMMRVASHPPTAATFTTATPRAAARLGRTSAHRPTPSWSTVMTTNNRASSGCSA